MKKLGILLVLVLFSVGIVSAGNYLRFPVSWVVSNSGSSIDANNNGIVDTCDSATGGSGNTTAQIITAANTTKFLINWSTKISSTNTWNTTLQMITASNSTGLLVNYTTKWQTNISSLNNKIKSVNTSIDRGGNSTAEMKTAVNTTGFLINWSSIINRTKLLINWSTKDRDTWNTTLQMITAVNNTGLNGSEFTDINCDQIVFSNGKGSAGICDGIDASGAGGGGGHIGTGYLYNDSTYMYLNESKLNSTIKLYGNTSLDMIEAINGTALITWIKKSATQINSLYNFVGINENNPLAQLHVTHTNNDESFTVPIIRFTTSYQGTTANDGGFIGYRDNQNLLNISNLEEGNFSFATNKKEVLRLTAGGNITIKSLRPCRGRLYTDAEGMLRCNSTLVVDTNTWNTSAQMIKALAGNLSRLQLGIDRNSTREKNDNSTQQTKIAAINTSLNTKVGYLHTNITNNNNSITSYFNLKIGYLHTNISNQNISNNINLSDLNKRIRSLNTSIDRGGNTSREMQIAVNNTGLNATKFTDIDCDQIIFSNGKGSAGICDGVDASGTGGGGGHIGTGYLYNDSTYMYLNESKLNKTIRKFGNTTAQFTGKLNSSSWNRSSKGYVILGNINDNITTNRAINNSKLIIDGDLQIRNNGIKTSSIYLNMQQGYENFTGNILKVYDPNSGDYFHQWYYNGSSDTLTLGGSTNTGIANKFVGKLFTDDWTYAQRICTSCPKINNLSFATYNDGFRFDKTGIGSKGNIYVSGGVYSNNTMCIKGDCISSWDAVNISSGIGNTTTQMITAVNTTEFLINWTSQINRTGLLVNYTAKWKLNFSDLNSRISGLNTSLKLNISDLNGRIRNVNTSMITKVGYLHTNISNMNTSIKLNLSDLNNRIKRLNVTSQNTTLQMIKAVNSSLLRIPKVNVTNTLYSNITRIKRACIWVNSTGAIRIESICTI